MRKLLIREIPACFGKIVWVYEPTEEEIVQQIRIPLGQGIAGSIAASGKPMSWKTLPITLDQS